MKTLTKAPVPFALNFVEPISQELYVSAVKEGQALKDSYDPATQTSCLSIYAGTSRTYRTTGSNLLLTSDDTEQSDT